MYCASHLRRGDKSMSSWVSIIPGSEVPVERCDDCILLSFFHIFPKKIEKKSAHKISNAYISYKL